MVTAGGGHYVDSGKEYDARSGADGVMAVDLGQGTGSLFRPYAAGEHSASHLYAAGPSS